MTSLARTAPAKINLTLHVTGQRTDGYHLLDSLVVFTEFGDGLVLEPEAPLSLVVTGQGAAALVDEADNLVLRAARLFGATHGGLTLDKRLPVASGMGGGSSDAAATLHLLAEASGRALPGTDALMRLGADLPVCVAAPRPSRMQGLGEHVSPVDGLPPLWLLLVNPGVGLSTPAVFRALVRKDNPPMPTDLPRWRDAVDLAGWLAGMRNDLQEPACALVPPVAGVLDAISAQPGCLLARMTGSGATCFGIFADQTALHAAQAALRPLAPFVEATRSLS